MQVYSFESKHLCSLLDSWSNIKWVLCGMKFLEDMFPMIQNCTRQKKWRGRPEDSKQGSAGIVELDLTDQHMLDTVTQQCLIIYNTMISKGIAPEQARSVLPQSMMTEWIWSGTLYAFARVCNLRCAKDTQQETQQVADQIRDLCAEQFPISWKYLHGLHS